MSEEITRLRPSRFCQADGLVRPYNLKESEGNKLLLELEKGKFATTDIYAQHYIIIEKKEILMLTDKRMAYIVHNDIFGGWQVVINLRKNKMYILMEYFSRWNGATPGRT